MKRHAPATARNSGPIADVLAQELPASGLVLEIASGTGEHALFMASRFPELTWQPSDFEQEAVESIDAWASEAKLANLRPAIQLDASQPPWPVGNADAILCVNMVHISPWRATEGLFAGARRILTGNAPLILYGPYIESDIDTSHSNLEFDASLKARNPEWGLRQISDMDDLARAERLHRTVRHPMPANNLMLVYRPAPPPK